MKKYKINQLFEYLPLSLILSYFYIHNIFLVLIGIILSLYFINIDFIHRFYRSINKELAKGKASREISKNDMVIKNDSIQIKSNKEYNNLTLVESVEKLGFIPSKDIDKNINSI
tara:strand:+ start:380 stop:721 length:342 start_codon:yes stop_codon:yes gene_type:complete